MVWYRARSCAPRHAPDSHQATSDLKRRDVPGRVNSVPRCSSTILLLLLTNAVHKSQCFRSSSAHRDCDAGERPPPRARARLRRMHRRTSSTVDGWSIISICARPDRATAPARDRARDRRSIGAAPGEMLAPVRDRLPRCSDAGVCARLARSGHRRALAWFSIANAVAW
eukprot:COSAG02_NODE_4871_length_4878_cov_1.630885_1_plen_169_part_00